MAQIFATDFGWSQCFSMSRKSKVHEALGLLFAPEGFPPKAIVDNAKDMKMGEFSWKFKEAHCYLQSTEPYLPWPNSAEREIRELKKGAAQKLMLSGVPLWLWYFALDYKSYAQSHTAHDIYKLMGVSPRQWSWVKAPI
jgi:hypothetical protein